MFAMPSATVLLLGLLCLSCSSRRRHAGLERSVPAVGPRFEISGAGLGYAAFSVAMATGGLLGDRITTALGPLRVVRYGGLVAASGFALATFAAVVCDLARRLRAGGPRRIEHSSGAVQRGGPHPRHHARDLDCHGHRARIAGMLAGPP